MLGCETWWRCRAEDQVCHLVDLNPRGSGSILLHVSLMTSHRCDVMMSLMMSPGVCSSSGGVVWQIRASDTRLVCAAGSRNGAEETKLLVLDFDLNNRMNEMD